MGEVSLYEAHGGGCKANRGYAERINVVGYTSDREHTGAFERGPAERDLISQKVSIHSFCKSQLPHKSVSSLLTLVILEDKLTDSCGNRLLQDDFINCL